MLATRMMMAASTGLDLLPETEALIARFTTPPTRTRSIQINTLIGALITGGTWAKLDALYVMAQYDAQAARQNWIQNAYNLTAVSSPTFTTDRGYATNGSSSYLDTNLALASAVQYQQDSAHLGLWSRTATQSSGGDIGARTLIGFQQSIMILRTPADAFAPRINVSASPGTFTSTDGSGHFIGLRTNSSDIEGYYNGASISAPVSATSVGRTAQTVTIGAINTGGTIGAFNPRQYASAHIGAGLSAGEISSFYAALLTYMQAVGAA